MHDPHFMIESYLKGLQPLLLPLNDLFATVLTSLAAYFLSLYLPLGPKGWPWPDIYGYAVLVAMLLQPLIFHAFNLYRAWRGERAISELIKVLSAWACLFLALFLLAGLIKTTAAYSRQWVLLWASLGAVWLIVSRILLRRGLRTLRERGFDEKRILLAGDPDMLTAIAAILVGQPEWGFRLVGYCTNEPVQNPVLAKSGYLGNLRFLRMLRADDIDQIWLAFKQENISDLRAALSSLRDTTATVRVAPDLFSLALQTVQPVHVGPITLFELNRTPLEGLNGLVKRVEDLVLASLALMLATPLMLMIALGIRVTSPGPVLFQQSRHGWHGRPFSIYKFRTMHLHQEKPGQITQARPNDERIFPLGKWLRRTSLDELPQLFNVLRGSMSLVGPRPHAQEHNYYFREQIGYFMWRHSIKPGMTGWAQIHGLRGETPSLDLMQRRLEYDLYYIHHWTLWLDIEILILTVLKGFTGDRAY